MKKVIHQGFDFAQLGGFPLNQQRLEWMQTAYAELSGGLAAMFGDNVIVSGCIVSGQSVSDGWIVVNGELLPFLGSQTGVLDTFLIRTDLTPLTFKDASNKSVQFRKYAQFGTSSDAIAWNSLKRMASYTDVSAHLSRKDNPHGVTKSQVGLGNIPNAISDNPNLNRSDVIASTAATAAVMNAIPVIKLPPVKLDLSATTVKIVADIVIDVNKYMPVAKVFFPYMYRVSGDPVDDIEAVHYIYDNTIKSINMLVIDGKLTVEINYDASGIAYRDIYKIACSLIKIND